MSVSIGIGIGKTKCDACAIDDNERVIGTWQYANTHAGAREFAASMADAYGAGECRAACETAGNMWHATYDAFEEAGISIKLTSTYKMAIISGMAKKTDRTDAQRIAEALSTGMLPECYVPSAGLRAIRDMARQRFRLAQDRTRAIDRARRLLDKHGIKTDASGMCSKKELARLEALSLEPAHDQIMLQQHIRQMRSLAEIIAEMDAHLRKEAAGSRHARLLASMPGMGTFTSLLVAAEIGDVSRFAGPKNMVSWAGLCPAVRQRGSQKHTGGIKPNSNRLVRQAMCEAAGIAIMHDGKLRASYESARRRHADEHAPAIIVVANKMVTIAWHILASGKPYGSHGGRKLAATARPRQQIARASSAEAPRASPRPSTSGAD